MILAPFPVHDPKSDFEKRIRSNATALSMGASDEDLGDSPTERLLAAAAHLLVHYRELDP